MQADDTCMDRSTSHGPDRDSAGRDAGCGLLGDNTGGVVLAGAEPVFATNGHSNACRRMGGNPDPLMCVSVKIEVVSQLERGKRR